MNGYYGPLDNALNEARAIVSQMSVDDLKRLMNNDEELRKLVQNLNEVSKEVILAAKKTVRSLLLRYNKWKRSKTV